jgi:predicted nucleic acid-binding protein
MQRVFADTWFYLAALNPADPNHARSVALARAERRHRVTTDWVLVEVGDLPFTHHHKGGAIRYMLAARSAGRSLAMPSQSFSVS